ncbi:MAG: DUF177 domain-containing protein [Oscillospiraceae bacterium]|nr:DUF177 domain-containing protein [Oscillospiraceae bacterium]
MRLDLRELIVNPEARLPFRTELETDRLSFPSVKKYLSPPRAEGTVFSEAGILLAEGTITAEMLCICDRCGQEFESVKETDVDAVIVQEESEEYPEFFALQGTVLDLQELLSTCLILDMETKFLCREDCKGLCARCGRNLNLGPCGCGKEIDPRFQVLGQLLDKESSTEEN